MASVFLELAKDEFCAAWARAPQECLILLPHSVFERAVGTHEWVVDGSAAACFVVNGACDEPLMLGGFVVR